MNIIFLTLCFNKKNREAMNITTRLLAEEFTKSGHLVAIASHRNVGEKKYEKMNGVHIARVLPRMSLNLPYYLDPFTFMNHILTQPLGLKFLQKKLGVKFDIIINVSSSPLIIKRGLLARMFAPRAKLVSLLKAKSSFKNLNIYTLLNKSDAIVTSSLEINQLLKRKGLSKKVHHIRSPIDHRKFRPLKRTTLKKKYGYDKNKIILYYGHFNAFKGVEYLIKSMRFLKTKSVKLLLIPSKNQDKHTYAGLIEEEGAKKIISVLNSNIKIEDYVSLADTVVMPYPALISTESNPSCILESMASQTPVITSDLTDLRDMIRHRTNGLLARPRDPKDIAKKIDLILSDSSLRKRIVKNGYKTIKQFEISRVAKKHLTLYKQLLND